MRRVMKFRVRKHLEKVLKMEWMLMHPQLSPSESRRALETRARPTSDCGEAEHSYLGWGALKG